MSTFNIHRFGQALKCQLMVGRKTWIRLFFIFTLVMFMFNLFSTRVQGTPYEIMETWGGCYSLYHTYKGYIVNCVGFGIIFFCVSMLFGASGMFPQMKDTRKRSAYLLWPVSNLEKYVISILLSTVLLAIVTIGAFVLADALRVLIDWTTGRIIIWGTPEFLKANGIRAVGTEGWQFIWMGLTFIFYFHSFYIVGGTLFRRHQFLFTSGTIIVVAILLIMAVNQIDWSGVDVDSEFISNNWDMRTQQMTHVFHPLFYIFNIVLTLLVIFHYWLSYKLFCRMQVINNKWLNV